MITLTPYSLINRPVVPCVPADPDDPRFQIEHDTYDVHPAYRKFNLPLPPISTRPPARIGQIYWPCWGISRFAVGHVLVTAEAYAEMIAVSDWVSAESQGLTVTLTDDVGSIDLEMFVSSARPFGDPRTTADKSVNGDLNQLWILTLTDTRYAADSYQAFTPASGGNTLWAMSIQAKVNHFFTCALTAAQIQTILDATTPHYPAALAEWWGSGGITNFHEPSMIDALCGAVNLRVAVQPDGNYTATPQGVTEAAAALTSWRELWGDRMLTGGVFDTTTEKPVSITTYFSSSAGESVSNTNYDGAYYHLMTELNYLTSSGDRSDYTNRYNADVMLWLGVEQIDARFSGFIPVPNSSIPYGVVYRSDLRTAETRVMRTPIHYPWPLAGQMGTLNAINRITSGGVSLTKTPPLSITTVNGIVTALS